MIRITPDLCCCRELSNQHVEKSFLHLLKKHLLKKKHQRKLLETRITMTKFEGIEWSID